MRVLRYLIKRPIGTKDASTILYGLQLSSSNFARTDLLLTPRPRSPNRNQQSALTLPHQFRRAMRLQSAVSNNPHYRHLQAITA